MTTIAKRVDSQDWASLAAALDQHGHGVLPALLTPTECEEAAGWFHDDHRFRSHVVMAKHGFGQGDYKYLADPLPALVSDLRSALYPRLAPVANSWSAALGLGQTFPERLEEFLAECAAAGQTKPTPLLLRYETDGYNCLHQDLYGSVAFPLQVVLLLSHPGRDFTGGEFTLVEQRPRAQSVPGVAAFGQGDALVFTTRYRPVPGRRGTYRVNVRHGVSRVTSGERTTLGIIFHNAG